MATLPPNFTLLQVVPALETGGVEQTTLDVSRAVVAAGGRSLVASSGGRLEDALIGAGGELVRLPMQSKNPLTITANTGRLVEVIEREKVSLVHVRSRAPAFSALGAARRTGVPLVATYHGVYNARGALKRWYNAVMTRGDLVIANSGFTRDHVIAEHGVDPKRVVAIARGTDLDQFDPAAVSAARLDALRQAWGVAADDGRVKVLLAGRLTRWKGQRLLIDAMARLRAQGRADIVVLLAGDDQGRSDYRAELEAAIAGAGLGEQVRLVGHCADMPAAWLIADLGAAPSLEPEAFGRTAVEPQLMGRPVLAADHGAARETVVPGRTGWLIAPGDAGAWAQALAAAADLGPEGRAAMGAAARDRARSLYSVEAMTGATFEVYRRVLAERAR